MGYSVPAAIGAKLGSIDIGKPDRQVVALVGDGDFMMTLSQLSVALQLGLTNIFFIVLNNHGWISIKDLQQAAFGEDRGYGTAFEDKEGNSYSPDFCLQLLRYTLTIDAREQEWAQAHQTVPRFQILSYPKILCIDALWNRYAYQRTLQACQTYKEIFIDGKRYDFPESLTYAAKEALPKDIKVPFTDDEFWSPGHGLYDADLALADPDANCGDLVNLDDEFIIDEEGADLFFQFELERALDFYHHGDAASFPASGLHYLMRLGVIQIFKNGINDWDMMLRIGNQLTRHQLRPILNQPEELIKRLT